MMELKKPQELMRLRRIALSSQGLLKARAYGQGPPGSLQAIKHLGYVQIDTISVVERAHHHVIQSRVADYRPHILNQLLREASVFEYWAHAAAFLPMEEFRFSLPYKEAIKSGKTHWYKKTDVKLMRELLARIRSDGPLRSRDVETKRKKGEGWWDWKPAKKALEQLYMQGDLMVSDREGFQKTYDLRERVIPAYIDTRTPSVAEFAEYLLEQQLRCHGLFTPKGVTYLRRDSALRSAVKTLLNTYLAEGRLEQFRLNGREDYFISAGALDAPLPRASRRMLILSPFDNCVIQRQRLQSLFQYEYQIECYLPEAKRRYGYFCLPLLYRDQFIGRMDCKAHRKERHFEIKALYFEDIPLDDALLAALLKALSEFILFQQCDRVSLTGVQPSKYRRKLVAALKPLS